MLAQRTHVTSLLQYLISTYFIKLSTVLIVYDVDGSDRPWHNESEGDGEEYRFESHLMQEYLQAVQESFANQSRHGQIIGLQWINVAKLNESEFEEQMLRAVDNVVTEGFITILSNTAYFLHARYYATRNSELRLKDKLYLFLCAGHEKPQDLLAMQLLQFYPHHLMVTPGKQPAINVPTLVDETGTPSTPSTTTGTAPAEALDVAMAIATAKQTTEIKSTLNKFIVTSRSGPTTTVHNSSRPSPTITDTADIISPATVSSTPPPQQPTSDGVQSSVDLTSPSPSLLLLFSLLLLAPKRITHRDINFELWTQKFVGNDVQGNLIALHLDAFYPNESFAKNVELYPNKVENLMGRTVRVGSITYIPYVVTNYVEAGAGNVDPINSSGPNLSISYVGSEAEIVKTFCHVRNCHLRVEPYGIDNWGVIYDNETATGMLGDIYKQRVELAIGCIYNWYNDVTESSHSIARSAVTILGPAPASIAAWRTNIMPFSNDLWLFLIFTVLLCAFIFYIMRFASFTMKNLKTGQQRKFRHIECFLQSLLDIFALFIQQPSGPAALNRFAVRLFLATLLCATITLENTYSGQLKSMLTVPFFGDPVDTMEKFSRTDWHWGAPSIVWVQTVESSEVQKEQILAKKFQIRDYNFLYNASFRPDFGLGIERLLSGAFSFGDFITPQALETRIIPKDDLYFDWTLAVSIRGWPLMPLFNRHVRACMESGLFTHWERQNVAKYLDHQTQEIMLQLASGHTNKVPLQKLTVENISGALFALMLGCLVASIIFCLELLVHFFGKQFLNAEHRLIKD